MTQDEIIAMVQKAGFEVVDGELRLYFDGNKALLKLNYMGTVVDGLKDFAALVAAHERDKQAEQEPVAWINEDELPEHYPYEEMFNASTIIDGVRMFPNVKMSARSMFYGLTKDHTWLSVTESQFNKLKPEKRMKCYLTPVDTKAIRAEAYQKGRDDMKEEAAKEAWNLAPTDESAGEIAAAIRNLK